MTKSVQIFLLSICLVVPGLSRGQQTQEQRTFSYANQLFQDGMYDIAIEQFQQYLDQFPQSPRRAEVALNIGRAYYNLKQYDQALQAFVKVDIDYPDSRQAQDAQWFIGETYESLGKWEQAARAFQRLYNYYPQSDRAGKGLLRGANDALKSQNLDMATDLLNTVIENFYDTEYSVEGRLQLATIYQQQAKYPLAWNELDKALSASPTESQRGRIQLAMARTAEKLWGSDRAESIYVQLQKDFHGKPLADQATLELGDLTMLRGDYSGADRLYSQAEKSSTKQIQLQATSHHGDLFWAQQDYQAARKYYNEALNMVSDPAKRDTLWFKYGLAMEKAGMVKPAYVQFSELVKPGQTEVSEPIARLTYNHLAVTARDLAHYPEAITALRHLAEITDRANRASVFQRIGDIYAENLHDYLRARTAFTTVLDSFPNYRQSDQVVFGLGKTLAAAGNYGAAELQFRELLTRYPYTDLRGQAQDQLWYIQHFHSGNQQMSFQRLATLFGDLLLDRDRQELFFELGKLYFKYQQDYPSAINQFQTVANGKVAPALQDSVNWYLAESNRVLAHRANINGDTSAALAYTEKAVGFYTQVMNAKNLSRELQAEAAFHLGELTAGQNPEQAIKYFTSLQDNPSYAVRTGIQLAEIYRARGQLSQALTQAQKIILNYDYTNDPNYQNALILAASIAAAGDQPDLASQYFSRYLQVAPQGRSSAEANWMLMRNAINAGEYKKARQYAEQIQSDAFYTHYAGQVNEQLGQIYIKSEEYQTAAQWFANLTQNSDPEQALFLGTGSEKNQDAIYWAGFAYAHSGNQAEAAHYYRRYAREGTASDRLMDAYKFLADYAVGQNKYDEARQLYLQAASFAAVDSQSVSLKVRAADMLFDNGKYAAAAKELKTLSQDLTGQEKYSIWEKAVTAYVRGGDLRTADSEMKSLSKAARYKEDALPVLRFQYEQSKVLAANKRLEDSQAILTEILSHDLPEDFKTQVQYEMARQMVIANKYEDAIDQLTKLTVDHPDDPIISQVYITLGTVLVELQQPGKAIQAFRNSLEKGAAGKYKQTAMNNLIKLYQDAGLWDSAIAMAKQYIQEFPNVDDNFATRIMVGTFLTNMGEYNRAIDYFEGLLQEADSESAAEIQYYIGSAYYKQNKFKQAITEYLKVPYLNPHTKLDWSTNALWYAGQSYEKMGDVDRAIALYRRIVDEKGATSNYGRFALKRIDQLTNQPSQQ